MIQGSQSFGVQASSSRPSGETRGLFGKLCAPIASGHTVRSPLRSSKCTRSVSCATKTTPPLGMAASVSALPTPSTAPSRSSEGTARMSSPVALRV